MLADVDGLLVPPQVVEDVHATEVGAQRRQGVPVLGPQRPGVSDEPQRTVELTALGQDLGPHVPRAGPDRPRCVRIGTPVDPHGQPLGPPGVPVDELGGAVQDRD